MERAARYGADHGDAVADGTCLTCDDASELSSRLDEAVNAHALAPGAAALTVSAGSTYAHYKARVCVAKWCRNRYPHERLIRMSRKSVIADEALQMGFDQEEEYEALQQGNEGAG